MTKQLRIGLDLDGTLIETSARHKIALDEAARSLGVKLLAEFLEIYYQEKRNGVSGKQVLLHHGIPKADEISRLWIENVENELLLRTDSLFPLVLNKLKAMVGFGAQFYLVTGRQHQARALRQIKALGIGAVMNQSFVAKVNEKGERQLTKSELTRNLGLNAVIGDSEVDEEWARDINAQFYAVECGIRSNKFWQQRHTISYETTLLVLEQLLRVQTESAKPSSINLPAAASNP
jgi:phosphoglycolate phosphatase-like HAD superfamily hydrolase